ncbi:HesB/IscA family protein [Roseateles saccharophilus]|uniref:Iron-sulfur cluster assembly accessory protein n=1 Tax=Roseateles saccharophilus TaxID=304 RepID=A0A4R3VK69_ROSSA|nr:iron-sulfur cluster assembly accessory protein [Roseateles saccharophilus]MDG0832027.1 iron-sulfur cluster assembly accessory protein [Roseateles saccharophilus]TCV03435.1 iron-sulfur cluster assembly accessory protein [Roseateles saccharophilus]
MLQPAFTVTPAAAKFIRRMVRFSEHPAGGFRLTVTPGGCSGYSAEFSVEPAPRAGDSEVQVDDVRLYLPAESRLMLEGVTVDFTETPTSAGLSFVNPRAGTCGCSSSADASPPAEASVAVSAIVRKAARPAGH